MVLSGFGSFLKLPQKALSKDYFEKHLIDPREFVTFKRNLQGQQGMTKNG